MAPGEKERGDGPAKSALRKVRTATLVITLARGWQQWANENSIRQAQEPAGWMPGGTQHPPDTSGPATDAPTHWKAPRAPKPASPKPEGCGGDAHGAEEASAVYPVKRKEVTRTVVSKAYERGDLGHLGRRHQQEGGPPEADADRLLRSRGSPTRRRKCARLVAELTRGWKAVERQGPQCRSDGVDTEDSGYGGEADERPGPAAGQEPVARIRRPSPAQ